MRTCKLVPFLLLTMLCVLAQSCAEGSDGRLDSGTADAREPPPDLPAQVRIIVEPSDGGSALLAAMNGAKKSLHMTMYLLTDEAVRSALITRHQAGVDVKVLLNKVFPGAGIDNQPAYDALRAAGVAVAWAPASFTYTHEKCVVIDGTTAWIMTMNATHAGLTQNREYLAVDTLASDVAEAEAQFVADFANRPFVASGDLLVSPVTSRSRILALIDGARSAIDLEDEELSDAQVVTALCNAVSRHVHTRGVLAAGAKSPAEQAAVGQLKSCGVTMVSLAMPYIHAKAIAVDGASAYIGSENMTAVSLDKNRELGLIVTAPAAVGRVASAVAADIAAGVPL